MKPVQAEITNSRANDSIALIREYIAPNFAPEFHFHEECQLVYIVKGSGKRIIGDSVDNFEENELVFIGSNIPHVWSNAPNKNPESQSISLSLFLSPKPFIERLKAFGDLQKTELLFDKARRGMYITGATKTRLINLLNKASTQNGIKHLITLLKIIYILSTTEEYYYLASSNYVDNFQFRENDRMNRVYRFLLENFKNEIPLSHVADIAGMNPHAFCRFFKSRTQKPLTQFINEIRIGHACKLLRDKNESITQIAFESGFNNVSNFNRFFKMIKKISPREYRNQLNLN
ncbi:MAG: helix-turn-helix transcriptional regulator [Sphingobacteriaceae bacterium]|nr:helix-turn-helix transcriptional regulator [Sphingobacteriaceae bacterium]